MGGEFVIGEVKVSAERVGDCIGFAWEPLRVKAHIVLKHELSNFPGNLSTKNY